MTFKSKLQTWAVTLDIDEETNTAQRLTIPPNLFDKGWLRNNPVGAQHLNQLLYLLSGSIKEETLTPSLNLSDVSDPEAARTNLDLLTKSSNLSDVPSAATARTNLGVNTSAEIQDAVINTIYPVGSIYTITGVSTNPATILGVGTWVAYGQGRVLIGVGTGSVDANGDSLTIADGDTGGEVNHTLTEAEMPSHTHTAQLSAPTGGVDSDDNFAGTNDTDNSNSDTTETTGGGDAHNNVQPFLGVFLWKRTA